MIIHFLATVIESKNISDMKCIFLATIIAIASCAAIGISYTDTLKSRECRRERYRAD